MFYFIFGYSVIYTLMACVEMLTPRIIGSPSVKLTLAGINIFLTPLFLWTGLVSDVSSVAVFSAMLLAISSAFAVTAVADDFKFLSIGHAISNVLLHLIYLVFALAGYIFIDFTQQPLTLTAKLDIVALFAALLLYVPIWLGKSCNSWTGTWCGYAAGAFLVMATLENSHQLLGG